MTGTSGDAGPSAARRLTWVGGKFFDVRADRVLTDPGTGRVIDGLFERYPRLRVAGVPAPEPSDLLGYELHVPRDRFVELPHMATIVDGVRQTAALTKVVRELEADADLLMVQLVFSSPFALLRPRTPRVYHVVGDVLGVTSTSSDYTGWRRPPAVALGWAIDRAQRSLIGRDDARVVTNGRALLERYGEANGRAVVSSTLRAVDIGSRTRQRPADAPFQVLFVGYLRPGKGIDTLLAAYLHLLDAVPDAQLRIVGPGEISSLTADDVALLERAQARGSVRVDGPIPHGPELFQAFADADVTAVPSRPGEGTPRVLIDARAFGSPVVSTLVAGIPDSVTDGVDGLLVAVDDPVALGEGLRRLAGDPELRARLAAAGLARARKTTVEAYVASMAEEVEHLARSVDR